MYVLIHWNPLENEDKIYKKIVILIIVSIVIVFLKMKVLGKPPYGIMNK